MDKGEIKPKVAEIPIIPLGVVPDDHELWEETDGGAHFKLTRHILPVFGGVEMISLSISGKETERDRVIGEFVEVLGEPYEQGLNPASIRPVDMLAWLDWENNFFDWEDWTPDEQ